jgi:hypothetical protein
MADLTRAACGLDPEALGAQGRRYAQIGASVLEVKRSPRRLVVRLGPDADLTLVVETLRVERECCPFFELDFDAGRREMVIGVTAEENLTALDAIAHSLGSGASA